MVKNPPKRQGFNPWVRKIPREGNGNPLQYSCLGNPTDRGRLQGIVHGVRFPGMTGDLAHTHAYTHTRIHTHIHTHMQGFPGGAVVKNPPANAGDARHISSVPGSGRSPGGGNGNHSSNFAWGIPWTEKPGRLQSMGSQRA